MWDLVVYTAFYISPRLQPQQSPILRRRRLTPAPISLGFRQPLVSRRWSSAVSGEARHVIPIFRWVRGHYLTRHRHPDVEKSPCPVAVAKDVCSRG